MVTLFNSIVDARTERSILLLDKKDRCSPWQEDSTDKTFIQEFLDLIATASLRVQD